MKKTVLNGIGKKYGTKLVKQNLNYEITNRFQRLISIFKIEDISRLLI